MMKYDDGFYWVGLKLRINNGSDFGMCWACRLNSHFVQFFIFLMFIILYTFFLLLLMFY